ncbi:histidine phosphatase superfamily [Hypoxylon fragiforme]|uniref:histidine phosphatase superfamily n=1 Tax=Hypoxylon fragiforme TaxID=63214 RepID=UPI0020C60AE8|nr:histidine phosphatase superfamily [Hypoxylon fragiforme]KAI2610652.1 histidine phosphatase superfamily [Hypoxylon fragiforme]
MATIHVFRHAEALHNILPEFRAKRDPEISDAGRQQCIKMASEFPFMDQVTHLISSPLSRALSTIRLAFAPVAEKQQIIVFPELTEAGIAISSFGSSIEELQEKYGDQLDLSHVPDDWEQIHPRSRFAYDLKLIFTRAALVRERIIDLASTAEEGSHIVVMTHGQTAHFMTGDFSGPEAPTYLTNWNGNLQYRSYAIDLASRALVETPESRVRRGILGPNDPDAVAMVKAHICQRILCRMPEVHALYEAYNKPQGEGL